MRILLIADTHFLNDYQGELEQVKLNYSPKEKLIAFLDSVDFSRVDAVIHLGDIVHSAGVSVYKDFDDLLRSYLDKDKSIYYCVGNHDNKEAFYDFKGLSDYTKPYDYTIDLETYKLIFMDTSLKGKWTGGLSKAQEEWLLEQLEVASKNKQAALLFQHHPFNIGWKNEDPQMLMSKNLASTLEHSSLKAIFTGHLHMQRFSLVAGIPQYSLGSLAYGIDDINGNLYHTNKLQAGVLELEKDILDLNPLNIENNLEILSKYPYYG